MMNMKRTMLWIALLWPLFVSAQTTFIATKSKSFTVTWAPSVSSDMQGHVVVAVINGDTVDVDSIPKGTNWYTYTVDDSLEGTIYLGVKAYDYLYFSTIAWAENKYIIRDLHPPYAPGGTNFFIEEENTHGSIKVNVGEDERQEDVVGLVCDSGRSVNDFLSAHGAVCAFCY